MGKCYTIATFLEFRRFPGPHLFQRSFRRIGYNTDEDSRNNWLFALLTNGDGWHNNHHADPRSAAHGFHRWWELDVTFLSLQFLALVGLVHEIVPRRRLSTGTASKEFSTGEADESTCSSKTAA